MPRDLPLLRYSRNTLKGTLVSLTVSFLAACGDGTHSRENAEERLHRARVPAPSNFASWESSWVTDSWIVALAHGSAASQGFQALRNSLVRSMLRTLGIEEQSVAYLELGSFLSEQIDAEIIPVHGIPRLQEQWASQRETLEFGFVQLRNMDLVWQRLASHVSPDNVPGTVGFPSPETNARRQWAWLESTPGVTWAEPNLTSQALENTPPAAPPRPNEWNKSPFARALERIRWPQAMDQARGEGLLSKPRDVVVAVVDTGVDFQHPDLAPVMFRNPGEAKATPADTEKRAGHDDDGNLWVDDIHGIDATLAPGQVDPGDDPDPGVADLGGPGKSCPESKDPLKIPNRCGHGTHVAGLIAAKHDNDNLTLGVCPYCRILSLRVSRRCVEPRSFKAGKGICEKVVNKTPDEWERNGNIEDVAQVRALAYVLSLRTPDDMGIYTNVVNLSLGKYFYSRSLRALIKQLRDNDVIIVAAAGNHDTDTPMFPAAYKDVVAVCATSEDPANGGRGVYSKAAYSNFGDWVDVCAPGTNLVSTWPGPEGSAACPEPTTTEGVTGGVCSSSGTSMAGPLVAGAFGLMRALRPTEVDARAITEKLLRSANTELIYAEPNNLFYGDAFNGRPLWQLGHGLLDLECIVKGGCDRQNKVFEGIQKKVDQQIDQSGCVMSTVGHETRNGFWSLSSSLPFVLGQLVLVLACRRFWEKVRPRRG